MQQGSSKTPVTPAPRRSSVTPTTTPASYATTTTRTPLSRRKSTTPSSSSQTSIAGLRQRQLESGLTSMERGSYFGYRDTEDLEHEQDQAEVRDIYYHMGGIREEHKDVNPLTHTPTTQTQPQSQPQAPRSPEEVEAFSAKEQLEAELGISPATYTPSGQAAQTPRQRQIRSRGTALPTDLEISRKIVESEWPWGSASATAAAAATTTTPRSTSASSGKPPTPGEMRRAAGLTSTSGSGSDGASSRKERKEDLEAALQDITMKYQQERDNNTLLLRMLHGHHYDAPPASAASEIDAGDTDDVAFDLDLTKEMRNKDRDEGKTPEKPKLKLKSKGKENVDQSVPEVPVAGPSARERLVQAQLEQKRLHGLLQEQHVPSQRQTAQDTYLTRENLEAGIATALSSTAETELQLRKDLASKEVELQRVQESLHTSQSSNAELKRDFEAATLSLRQALERNFQNEASAIEDQVEAIADAKAASSAELQPQIEALKQQNQELESKAEDQIKSSLLLSKKVSELERDLKNAHAAIERRESFLLDADEELAAREKTHLDMENTIDSLKQQCEDQQRMFQQEQEEALAQESRAVDLQTQLENLRRDVLRKQDTGADEDSNTADDSGGDSEGEGGDQGGREEGRSGLKTEVGHLKRQLFDKDRLLDELCHQEDLRHHESAAMEAQEAVDHLQRQLKAADERAADTQQQLLDNDEQMKSLLKAMKAQQTAAAESEMNHIAKHKTASENLESLQKEILHLQTERANVVTSETQTALPPRQENVAGIQAFDVQLQILKEQWDLQEEDRRDALQRQHDSYTADLKDQISRYEERHRELLLELNLLQEEHVQWEERETELLQELEVSRAETETVKAAKAALDVEMLKLGNELTSATQSMNHENERIQKEIEKLTEERLDLRESLRQVTDEKNVAESQLLVANNTCKQLEEDLQEVKLALTTEKSMRHVEKGELESVKRGLHEAEQACHSLQSRLTAAVERAKELAAFHEGA